MALAGELPGRVSEPVGRVSRYAAKPAPLGGSLVQRSRRQTEGGTRCPCHGRELGRGYVAALEEITQALEARSLRGREALLGAVELQAERIGAVGQQPPAALVAETRRG